MSNVTNLHPAAQSPLTPEQTSHRILAAVRVVNQFYKELVKTDTRLRAIETTALAEATKAYREVVRDADDRSDSLTPKESHVILPKICAGLREHDRIKEANTVARKARAAEQKRVGEAHQELQGPLADGDQQQLPTSDQTGLGWFCQDTVAVVYTALLDASERETIDPAQLELLAELAGAGLEAITFVVDAAGALDDEDEDDEPESDNEAIAELDAIADDLPT